MKKTKSEKFNFVLAPKHADMLRNISKAHKRPMVATLEVMLEKEAKQDGYYRQQLKDGNL